MSPRPSNASNELLAGLLEQSSHGDEQSFARFYDLTSTRVFSLALKITRDWARAEEVAQEVFCEVWRNSSRFDLERGKALTWTLAICHHKAVSHVRANEASRMRDSTYGYRNQNVAHDTTAEEAVISVDGERVRSAMRRLTFAQRQAIELTYFGGLSCPEIAELLQVPVGTIKTRIRDGLKRLRKLAISSSDRSDD